MACKHNIKGQQKSVKAKMRIASKIREQIAWAQRIKWHSFYVQWATNSSLSLKHSTNEEEWTDTRLETGKGEIIKDLICQAKEFKLYLKGYVEL